jgi:3-oxoacyl-[acyl-carrier-protein] synthase I
MSGGVSPPSAIVESTNERWSVRRVAITGMGIVSAIGNNTKEVLASLQQGRSGIEFIPERKAMGFRSALGGRITGLPPLNIPKRNLRQMGLGSIFAVHAAQQALEDAGLEGPQLRSDRVGVVMGNMGNPQDIYTQCHMFHDKALKLGGRRCKGR